MNTYQKAVEKWGKEAQLNMIIEECGELITAIEHWKRGRGNIELIQEWADVEIMISQLPYIFPESVSYFKIQKKIKVRKLGRKIRGKEE
jgi:NTP pyrophosphatase (non-canonical NTP hydrolase)